MDKFTDTDIKEFLNVFNKAMKKVTNKKDKNVQYKNKYEDFK